MKNFFNTLKNTLRTPISSGFIFHKKLPNLKHIDIILECHDVNRGINYKGVAYAQLLDSFQDDLTKNKLKCITLAKSGSHLTKNKAYGSVYSPVTLIEELCYLALALLDKARITTGISSTYKVDLYKKILISSTCKAVIGIQPTRYLVAASRQLQLPVVDLLHGYCVSSAHHWYGINKINQTPIHYLCTDYIALDKDSMRIIKNNFALSNKKTNCWSLLTPVLKNKKSPQLSSKIGLITGKSKKILISLQWGIERFEKQYPHKDGELHPIIEELITHERMRDCAFIIKPHPIILRNRKNMNMLFSKYCNYDNIYIDDQSGLLALLHTVDAHITIFSSVVREAALLGVKSLIFSSDDHFFTGENYYFQPEIQHRIAYRVNNWSINQIISWIKEINKCDKIPNSYQDSIFPQHQSPFDLVVDILHTKADLDNGP